MTVKISKPAINIRAELADLKKPTGLAGEAMLKAETPQEQFNLISAGRKNLIINGSMRFAQRGTSSTSNSYGSVDRWRPAYSTGQYAGTQQKATDSPTGQGFTHSYKFTVNTPETSLTGTEYVSMVHFIEAQNLNHLCYGTSSAKTMVLSFWVKSSITGTYAISIYQNDATRNFVPTYTINSANTWEFKKITIPGDPSGTINNDNDIGMSLYWLLGAGADYTAGSGNNSTWGAYSTGNFAAGHLTDWAETSGATFFLTGVQLEVGSVCTPFDHLSYGEELALCQRYYAKIVSHGNYTVFGAGYCGNTTNAYFHIPLPVTMRAQPTIAGLNGSFAIIDGSGYNVSSSSVDLSSSGPYAVRVDAVSSGLTHGRGVLLRANNDNDAFIYAHAEI